MQRLERTGNLAGSRSRSLPLPKRGKRRSKKDLAFPGEDVPRHCRQLKEFVKFVKKESVFLAYWRTPINGFLGVCGCGRARHGWGWGGGGFGRPVATAAHALCALCVCVCAVGREHGEGRAN